ncbi:hypothetical protein NC651_037010 [Populus alba x Populus x berolinensis]|nr:hypothetical protein NC651_037010 [Populus alba x Populus x berolinensis]
MMQPPLQALQPSHTPPPSLSINLESQLTESLAQPSVTIYNQELSQNQETQSSHFTAINTEILLQTEHSQASQPHSTMEIELQSPPPPQLTPSPAINPQQINMIVVKQFTLEWPNIIMAFCFEAAIQIALQYENPQHSKVPVSFFLLSVAILLTFCSLLVSQLISSRFPEVSKVLEKIAISLAAIAFLTTIASPWIQSLSGSSSFLCLTIASDLSCT